MNNVEELQSKTIDWLRFPLMVMVVMIHVSLCKEMDYSLPVNEMPISAVIWYLLAHGICWAAVPTFFFISGYLFFVDTQKGVNPNWGGYYLKKLRKRFYSIFIPFIIASFVFLLCHYGVSILRATQAGDSFPSLIDILKEHGWLRFLWDNNRINEINHAASTNIIGITMHKNFPLLSPMWYLRDLMVVVLLSPIVYFFVTKTQIVGLVILGILYILNIWVPLEGFSVSAFFFFSLGAYLSVFNKNIILEFEKYQYYSYAIAIISLILMLISHSNNRYLEEIFVNIYRIAGVISFFNIASLLIAKDKVRIPKLLTQSSFFIYLVHCIYITGFAGMAVTKLLPYDNQFIIIFNYFLTVLVTVTICVILYVIMRRLCPKVLSVIVGGR